jgi:hypothetical protein
LAFSRKLIPLLGIRILACPQIALLADELQVFCVGLLLFWRETATSQLQMRHLRGYAA